MQVSVVGVPGTLANWRSFAPLFEELKKGGAENRTMVVETANSVTAEEAADSGLAQIRQNGANKCIVVGFSLGGIIAVHMATRDPETVIGLILLDMNGDADKPEAAASRRAAVAHAREVGLAAFVENKLWPSHVAKSRLSDAILLKKIQVGAEESGVAAFANQMEIAISRPRSIDLLAGLDIPILVFCGAEDVITPPALSKDIAGAVPRAKLSIIDEAGHFAILERPDSIAKIAAPWIKALSST